MAASYLCSYIAVGECGFRDKNTGATSCNNTRLQLTLFLHGATPTRGGRKVELAYTDILARQVQPDGWAQGEREGYGGPCDVTSLSLSQQ